ncbi:MAG: prepilin peptidase [Rhodoferax sp.]|uniref:A24 family peptidase n=1 Tax=Rhodoferax sp. TaxID=50421 RepID=UPI002731E723|nr:prepilin peptidase [Rhodoferax sp.]MDP1527940.1 prepilin peptidase [Rhodoferax sp.]MDP1944447.1 prepilin peptidase [Rhodoferax sp.]
MWFKLAPDAWQTLGLTALVLLVLTALVFDLRERRIPNTLVLLTLGAGLVVNLIGPQIWSSGSGLLSTYPGAIGIKGSLLGAVTGLAVFLPFYLLRAMGAGDVKLMAGIGSFVGPAAAINVALFILVAGGMLALVRMVWVGKTQLVLFNVVTALGQYVPGSVARFNPATQSADRMPYALAMAAGLLAYGAWIFSGHAPLVNF